MAQEIQSAPVPSFPVGVRLTTTEMHTGGEPLRIIEKGYPEPQGDTILNKRAWLRTHADHYRTLLMSEPRGHRDMYGVLLVTPDHPEADLGAIFMHNEGYSTMCGHAVIALGRYMVDRGIVPAVSPETRVVIQCPCGPVPAYVTCNNGVTSDVRFNSVPSYVFALDVTVSVPGVGEVTTDVVYGGAFYAILPAQRLGLDVNTSSASQVADTAHALKVALQSAMQFHHSDNPDLAFLYGTIVTDGGDHANDSYTTTNICVFADKQVDRSPCGSGACARVALQYHRGVLPLGKKREFRAGITGLRFKAGPTKEVELKGAGLGGKDVIGVLAEVSGHAHYSGTNTFFVEEDDPLRGGFLPR